MPGAILIYYFDIWNWGGGTLEITHEKYIMDGKVHAHLGFRLLPGSLTDVSA